MVSITTLTKPKVDWFAKLAEIRSEFAIPSFLGVLASNAETWAQEISVGPFWKTANKRLPQWRTEYRALVGSDLLPHLDLPEFVHKAESSIRDKLIRLCKLHESDLSKVIGAGGPPIPKLNDIVRTRVACRYIDGVEFLAKKFLEVGKETNCNIELSREGRIEGYFAQHITFEQRVILRMAGYEQMATLNCEIQIASELATRIWDASHPLYEDARTRQYAPEEWQWKPNDRRFIANQLGHMIHLADGLLVQLRDSDGPRDK